MIRHLNQILAAGCLAAAGLIATPDVSRAETPVTYTDQGRAIFRLSMPDFWQMRSGGFRVLDPDGPEAARSTNRVMGFSPTGDTSAILAVVSPFDVSTLEEGQEYLADVGRFLVEDADVAEAERRRIAGLPALRFAGQGRRNGRSVSFTATVIDLPGNRVVVAVAVLEAGATSEAVADLNALFASIRPAR